MDSDAQRGFKGGLAPADLSLSVGIDLTGVARWGEEVPTDSPGIYIVTLHEAFTDGSGTIDPPLDSAALEDWLARCSGLTVSGNRVGVDTLRSHLARWWLPNTSILYIGKATSLNQRLGQYYGTPLGVRSPHGGGYWLKTLSVLNRVSIHYATTPKDLDPLDWEADLLNAFLRLYEGIPRSHPERRLALPWANLEVTRPPPRRRREHGLPSLKNQSCK